MEKRSIFKSVGIGTQLEESKLRSADRLVRLISICCILAWLIQWITMLNLDERNRAPDLAFDKTERKIPGSHFQGRCRPVTLRDYINLVARMGGYLARKSDPPPGNLSLIHI